MILQLNDFKGESSYGFPMSSYKTFQASTKYDYSVGLVKSILEYCSIIWSSIYDIVNRIETKQKRFVRTLASKLELRKKLVTYNDRLNRLLKM